MFDLLIKGACYYQSEQPIYCDVGVVGDRILDTGNLNGATAAEVAEAEGKVLSPGLVDVHTHLDAQILG